MHASVSSKTWSELWLQDNMGLGWTQDAFSFLLLQLGRLNSGYSCGWENVNLGLGLAGKKDRVTSVMSTF